jgi:hypothetical protein
MKLGHLLGRLTTILGFIVLSIMVITLLSTTVSEAWQTYVSPVSLAGQPAGAANSEPLNLQTVPGLLIVLLLLLVAVGALAEMVRESRRVPCLLPAETACKTTWLNAASVLGGALLTYSLSWDVGLGAVTASALVGLLAAVVAPAYGVPIYCGSFVGMSSSQLLLGYAELTLAGAVAALVYVLTTQTYMGYGGKLGTIAFSGAVLTGLGLRRAFLITGLPDPQLKIQIVAYAIIAAVATYALNVSLGHGPVMGSSVVGLVGGLILPLVYPQHGAQLAVVVICASFAGMSGATKFPTFTMMFIAGLVSGVVFVYSLPLLGGAGGKLGTIAFASVLAVRGWWDLMASASPQDDTVSARLPDYLQSRSQGKSSSMDRARS